MARYPTFEEYQTRGNFTDGLKRCDDLLQKNPRDVQLQTVKLQLLFATDDGAARQLLDQLSTRQPPILDLGEIISIEDAVDNAQRDTLPRPNTVGPAVAKLWENAFKATNSMNHKLDLLSLRFSRAMLDDRLGDAQQALIQLKALQPKNRVFYMAHAAVTQLLSTSKEDLSSRLALSLARKAVAENFDTDESLDCRVPGQIFALQNSEKDLDNIANRRFKDSKQVFDVLRKAKLPATNGTGEDRAAQDPATVSPSSWLAAEVTSLRGQFSKLIASAAPLDAILAFAADAMRLIHTASTSIPDARGRGLADASFLSISALVRAYELTNSPQHLLSAAFCAETLLKHNPHVHEARLILVYIYMRLGLGSLGMYFFDSLKIKEIQHDTVGHVLFTNLSITHPHSTKLNRKDVFDPSRRLLETTVVYKKHDAKLAESEAGVLSHEQTGMLFDLQELRNHLRSSITKRIAHLDQRRLARLLNSPDDAGVVQMGPRLTVNWTAFVDNRDFAAAFDFGYNVEKVLYGYGGVLPGKHMLLCGLAADSAWCLAKGLSAPVKDPENLVEQFADVSAQDLEQLSLKATGHQPCGMSNAEFLAGDVARKTLRMLLNCTKDAEQLAKESETLMRAAESLPVTELVAQTDLFTEHLKDHYVYFDVLRMVSKACESLREKARDSHVPERIQTITGDYCKAIRNHAAQQAKQISDVTIRQYMEQDGRLRDSMKLFGERALVEFCQSIASSAKEGWEGVTKLAI